MPSDLLANPFSTSSPVVSSAATATITVSPDDSFDEETVCEVDLAADCHDPSFNLSEATTMTDSIDNSVSVYSDDKDSSLISDNKYTVFEQCLHRLFKRCMECGNFITDIQQHQSGSCLFITTVCISHHTCKWQSQPLVNNMAAGNLLLSAAILFSGSTFNKFSQLSAIARIKIMSHSQFHLIQDHYLFPVVADTHGRLTKKLHCLKNEIT